MQAVIWAVESLIPCFLSREFVVDSRVNAKLIFVEYLEAALVVQLITICPVQL